jgi:hypothetical protein
VRKLVVAALLVMGAACRSAPVAKGGLTTGASSPKGAIEGFLGAVKAQDLQAMSTVWGNKKGPARDAIERNELEKRELIMQCYLGHDTYRVVSEAPGEGDRRLFRVSLTKGRLTRETKFTTIEGPSGRWYVEDVDLSPTSDLCKQR